MDEIKPEIAATHCRLCAEETEESLLISTDSEEGLHMKISEKMSFINVDVKTSSDLPKGICFSCYDILERTWKFLLQVQSAQRKLNEIYLRLPPGFQLKHIEDITNATVKPVNCDWETFIKSEDGSNDPKYLLTVSEIVETESIAKLDYDSNTVEIALEPMKKGKKTKKRKNNFVAEDDIPIVNLKKEHHKKRKKLKKNAILAENEIKLERRSFGSDEDNKEIVESSIVSFWDSYTWICADCNTTFENISLLRSHSLEVHESCAIFKCYDCGKVMTNYKFFVRHVRMHNFLLKTCCEVCNKQFPIGDSIKSHRLEHDLKYDKTCKNCGESFEKAEMLKSHSLKYSKDSKRGIKTRRKGPHGGGANDAVKDVTCDNCGKQFKSKSNLQVHKQVHMDRRRDFFCHVCGKSFFTKGTLSTHILTHEDAKPFKCDFCGIGFRVLGNLRSHISLHSGVKPFVCDQCGKSFRARRHLKSHLIVHTDLMPYTCEYCNKMFRFKTRLNLHLRQHTGAKPYSCLACQRDFTNGSNFKKHMMRRHNIDVSRRKKNASLIPPEKLKTVLKKLKIEVGGI